MTVGTGGTLNSYLDASVSGAKDTSVTWSSLRGSIYTSYYYAPNTPGTDTLTATSVADPSKYARQSVVIQAYPTVSVSVSTTSPLYGARVIITPSFTGSYANIESSDSSVAYYSITSGSTYFSAPVTAPVSFTCTASNDAETQESATTATVTPQTVAVSNPVPAQQAVAPNGTVWYSATISGAVNTNVSWTATGGSFSTTTTASGGSTVWTAPSTPGSYTIRATSVSGTNATTTATVVAVPTVTSLSSTAPLYGSSWTIDGTGFTGLTAVKVGSTDITSFCTLTSDTQISVTGNVPQGLSGTVTVTATGGSGTSSQSVTIQTVTLSAITGTAYQSVNYVQTFSGATVSGAANTTVTWSSGGNGAWSGTQWTAPANPGTYQITATSQADNTKSVTYSVTVVPLPTATLTPTTSTPLYGAVVSLTPTFTNGSGTVDNDIGPVTSGSAVNSAAVTTSQIYTLTVTNQAGQVATCSTTLNPQTVTVSSISPANGTRSVNSTTVFSATVAGAQNATVNWSCSGGSITADGTWTAPSTPGSYTVTATAAAKSIVSVQTGVTVVALPQAVSLTASSTKQTVNYSISLTPSFSNGTAVIGTTPGASDVASSPTSGTAVSVTSASTGTKTYYLTVTNAAGDTTSTSVTVVYYAAPTASLSLTEASGIANDGKITQGATVTLTPTFSNGTGILGTTGQGSSDVSTTLTSGTGVSLVLNTTGTYVFTLTVTNPAGLQVTASATVVDYPAPTASLTGGTPVNYGGSVNLTPTFTNGTGVVDQGVGTVTSGTAFSTGTITVSKTYTLTVTNAAGTTATATQTVSVNTVTVSTITGPAYVTTGYTANYAATVTGATNTGVSWLVDGIAGGNATVGSITASGTYTAGTNLGAHTIKAVAAADGTTSQTKQVTVLVLPQAVSLTATKLTVTTGSSTQLTPVFSNGTAVIGTSGAGSSDTAATTSSGTAVSTGNLSANQTYTLTVTNQAGQTASVSCTVAVVAAPTITSLTASTGNPAYGSTFNLTPVFTNGSGVIDQGVGSVISGTGVSQTASWTGARTYTLTVTNAASDTATATVTVIPQVVTISAISGQAYQTVGTQQTFAGASVSGTANTAVSWAATAGSFNGAVYTAPATAQAVTVTASSVADPTKTVTFNLQVVSAPSITTFTTTKNAVNFGEATSFNLSFVGTGSIDHNIGSVTSGSTPTTGALKQTTEFTLTVTNKAGAVATQQVTVTVAAILLTTISGPTQTKSGAPVQFTVSVSGGLTNTVTWSTNGGSIDATGLYTPPKDPGLYTVTATSTEDPSQTATTQIQVLNLGSGKKSALASSD
jgi:hypothetical protein